MSVNCPSKCSSIHSNSHQSCIRVLSYLSFMNTIYYHLKIFINMRTKNTLNTYRNIKAALWRCDISGGGCIWHLGLWVKFLPLLLCLGRRGNRHRPPWDSLALTTTPRVWPKLDQLSESPNLTVLQLAAVNHLSVTHQRTWGSGLITLLRAAQGGGKSQNIISSSSVHRFSFSLPFTLSPPDISFAWHFFTWAAICPLSDLLAFTVL